MRRRERRAAQRGRSERSAGFVSIAVPRAASFLADVPSPGAYFLVGSVSSVPLLYWGSSARVVRQVRREFGLSSGDSYDVELGDRLADRWDSMLPQGVTSQRWGEIGDAVRDAWRDGETVPIEAFRALVWWAFVRSQRPEGPTSVLFSREVSIPRIGDAIGSRDASVSVAAGEVNANAWPFNPFSGEVPRGGDPVYDPWCSGSSRCDPYEDRRGAKKPGWSSREVLPALAVLGLIAMAGSK